MVHLLRYMWIFMPLWLHAHACPHCKVPCQRFIPSWLQGRLQLSGGEHSPHQQHRASTEHTNHSATEAALKQNIFIFEDTGRASNLIIMQTVVHCYCVYVKYIKLLNDLKYNIVKVNIYFLLYVSVYKAKLQLLFDKTINNCWDLHEKHVVYCVDRIL